MRAGSTVQEVAVLSFDSSMMRASILEIQGVLSGARINRVYQPRDLDLVLRCHGPEGKASVLLSADPAHARVQLTRNRPDNPPEPPMFCMLLRKRIEHGIIHTIYQDGLERVAVIRIESLDELADLRSYLLITETMGRHSNTILVEADEPPAGTRNNMQRRVPQGTVIDAIKRVTPDMSRVRQVLPGLPYTPPPAFDRPSLDDLDKDQLENALCEAGNKTAWRAILETYVGLSPTLAREFALECGLEPDKPLPPTGIWTGCIYRQLEDLCTSYQSGCFPLEAVYDADGYPVDFAAWHLNNTARRENGERQVYDLPSELLDDVYLQLEKSRTRRRMRKALLAQLSDAKKALETRKEHQLNALARAKEKEKYRVYGELVTANLHQIDRGAEEVRVTNWYDPEQREITIALDPSLEPSANAQRLFRRYNKLKRTEKRARQELAGIMNQLDYLEEMEYLLESAEDTDTLASLQDELRREGVIKKPKAGGDKREKHVKPYHAFRSSEGHTVYAGKNSRGNDLLATRMARAEDIWLHAKDLAGSHVIIRMPAGKDPEELGDTLLEAAQIAAYYSKGRASSNVPVDYTRAKHVRKPRGARPGMVIYDHQQTLWVTPDRALVDSLRILGAD